MNDENEEGLSWLQDCFDNYLDKMTKEILFGQDSVAENTHPAMKGPSPSTFSGSLGAHWPDKPLPPSSYYYQGMRMHPFRRQPSIPVLDIPIVTSPHMTKRAKRFRERKRTFSEWFWRPYGYGAYTPVEVYEYNKPLLAWVQGRIVCHPDLEREIREAMNT